MNFIVLKAFVRRNIKLFFTDMGMFLVSLITPVALLAVYITFLSNIYRDSFLASFPTGLPMMEELVNGCVSAQLVSSLLAVSCVTVAFSSNMLMVQDKVTGARRDINVSPVKPWIVASGYYIASFISTLIINFVAAAAGLAYMAVSGWYMGFGDVMLLLWDVVLLVMFGTAASAVVNFFLSSQGQISAVGTVVSSFYGFISGAYMPLSNFSEGLKNILSLLPGPYGTSLLRNHAMSGVLGKMAEVG
ncbi:MAG: ABC transporter permease, partial [Clostridia bacterium]|nr:ABC transporter permease [Clostridia bacterium]